MISPPSKARLIVWQQEHWTLDAPRMYISSVWHPPQTNGAISVPVSESRIAVSKEKNIVTSDIANMTENESKSCYSVEVYPP